MAVVLVPLPSPLTCSPRPRGMVPDNDYVRQSLDRLPAREGNPYHRDGRMVSASRLPARMAEQVSESTARFEKEDSRNPLPGDVAP